MANYNLVILRILFSSVAFLFLLKNGSADSINSEEVIVGSLVNVVNTYNAQLDKDIKWEELNATLKALDHYFDGYGGPAGSHMSLIQQLNGYAYNFYLQGVSSAFGCCVATNATLDMILEISPRDLSVEEVNQLTSMITQMINDGSEQINEAQDLFNQSITKMGELRYELGLMQRDLKKDLRLTGVYGETEKAEDDADNIIKGLDNDISRLREIRGNIRAVPSTSRWYSSAMFRRASMRTLASLGRKCGEYVNAHHYQ